MKNYEKALTAVLAAIAAAYAGGWLAQLLESCAVWQKSGGLANPAAVPIWPSLAPGAVLRGLLRFPYGVYAILLVIGGGAAFVFFVLRAGRDDRGQRDEERNLTYYSDGTYGTAGFMTEEERRKVLQLTDVAKTDGVILGKRGDRVLSLPRDSRMNQNMIVYGASGSMKSRAFVRNRVFQAVVRGESLIITDCKSEIYNDMSDYLRAHGYTVRVFNLINPECSDSWDCLAEIHGSDLMAQTFADVVIKNSSNGKGDHFWDGAEMNLLKALILYVDNEYSPDQRTLAAVYDLLSSGQGQALTAIGERLPAGHPARSCFTIFLQASDSVRAGAVVGLAGRLQTLQNATIRQITAHREIDLTLPGREKCAYFCITSDQDSTFEFLSSLFFSFLFIRLVHYADNECPGGRLPVPVHILGEELMNCGRINELGRRCSVIRSRGISLSIVVQGLGQLQNRYPDNEWVEIIGNADTTLFLGCTDDVTARFISDRAGDVTVAYSTDAQVYSTMQLTKWAPQYRESHSVGKRKLLTVDEVLRMPLDKELIILRGQKVLMAEKFDYISHPHTQALTPARSTDHIPRWRELERSPPAPPAARPAPKPKTQRSDEPLCLSDAHSLFL